MSKEIMHDKQKRKKLSAEELYAFSDEMSMMIESGISSLEAVTLMLEESENTEEKEILGAMRDTLYDTGSLTSAMQETGVFPAHYTYMLQMGEQTGKMDEVLHALANHYNREDEILKAVKSAISYPLLMVCMMLVIIVVLVTQIMPIFERVYAQLGSSMSGISGAVLGMGKFLGQYAVVFFFIVALLVAFIIYLSKSETGRLKMVRICSRNRSFRSIYDKIEISRFASGMAMTISSGMDIAQAVELSGGLVRSELLQKKLEVCKQELENTIDIGEAFAKSGIFIGLYGRMAILAAKTGNLEQVMEKVADTYQKEADEEIYSLIAVVEPTLVIVLSVVVGMILLSVMLPLLSIMVGMN